MERQIRGSFYIRQTRWGTVLQKWPRKRPRNNNPYRAYREAEFAYAATFTKYVEPIELQTAIALSKDTLLLPRDLLVMASYGNFFDFTLPDGTPVMTRTQVAPNPQLVLDMVTDVTGSLLFRADVGWVGVNPGNENDVLTMVGGYPAWAAGGGGGGAALQSLTATYNTVDSTAAATKGLLFEPNVDCAIVSIAMSGNQFPNGDHELVITKLSSATVTDVLFRATKATLSSPQRDQLYFEVSLDDPLLAGERYALTLSYKAGTGSSVERLVSANGGYLGFDVKNTINQRLSVASNNVDVGTVFTIGTNPTGPYHAQINLYQVA